ncbi:MAG: 50S ribosomal protein L10 [bacterium]
MALTREKKEQVLKELQEYFKNSGIAIFVSFHGLGVVLSTELRGLMKQAESVYRVAKKTLVKKVLKDSGYSGNLPELGGELAVVFGNGEITLPAKSLLKFGKNHPEIGMLGGVLNSVFLSKEEMLQLAKLPTRDVLLGQFVQVINAPRQQMVGVLQAPIRDFISVLSQINK